MSGNVRPKRSLRARLTLADGLSLDAGSWQTVQTVPHPLRPTQCAPAPWKWWLAGLSVSKIRPIFGHGVKRPDDLDLWPRSWCGMSAVARTTFLSISVYLDFSLSSCGQTRVKLTTSRYNLEWPLTFEVTANEENVQTDSYILAPQQVWIIGRWIFNPGCLQSHLTNALLCRDQPLL